jgi:hypothetical protein
MKTSASLFGGLLVPVFLLAAAFSDAAMAQGKAETKVLLENDKVRVYESYLKPGAEGESVERPFRVIRALTDGTIQRIYPDGKTQTLQWKAGEVRAMGPDKAYKPKNIGKSDFAVYVVVPK